MNSIGRSLTQVRSQPRRGSAMVLALICVLVVTMVSAVLVRTALVQRERLERDAWQSQADWLAISARERALALLASQSGYVGETWLPAAAAGTTLGRVIIEVANEDDTGRLLSVTVDVPDHPVERVRAIRTWRLPPGKSSINTDEPAVIDTATP